MVNLTDTFTKLYGRPPTQQELGLMMKLKAEQELRRQGGIVPSAPKKAKKKELPPKLGITVNKRGWMINCLLHDGYTKEQIANIMCITMEQLEYNANRYNLPRDDLVKPKE